MLYKGYFKSVLRDKAYRVEIQTGTNSTPAAGDITLGPSPFITQMESGSTIYSPVKYQNANVQIVNDEYMFSLYSTTAKQNSVKLYDSSNNLFWTGYTTPNIYNAPYDFEIETYSLEAIDGLAILRYYDYSAIGSHKDFRTFAEIINHLLAKSACYTHWYWNTNTMIEDDENNLPEEMTISEQCFFDEDNEPMKMNEVLEEICRFCGVTAITQGENVYFVDYDGIVNNQNTYIEYTVGNDTSSDTVELIDNKTITKDDYTETGSSLSLEGAYSKVTVKDSLYAVDSILPELFNDDELENVQFNTPGDRRWSYEFSYYNLPEIQKKFFNAKMKSYRNKNFNFYYYDTSTGELEGTNDKTFDGYNGHSYIGASLARYNVAFGDSSIESSLNFKYDDWEDYLYISNNYTNYDVKIIETKDEFIKPFFVGTNAKIVYSGSLLLSTLSDIKWHNTDRYTNWPYFPTTDLEYDKSMLHSFPKEAAFMAMFPSDIKIKCGISIGDYYATDSSTWSTDTSSTFYIPFCDKSVKDSSSESDMLREGKRGLFAKEKHDIFFKEHEMLNNVMYYDRIKEEGFCVSLSGISNETVVLGAKPKFTFYSIAIPFNTWTSSTTYQLPTTTYPIAAAWIKDLDVKAVIPFEGGKDETNTDTEYSYENNDDYVNEFQDITFKICTYDNKQLNYSAVAYPYNGNFKFVDNLVNQGLNLTNRSENICCYRIVNQYCEPVKKLQLNLYNDYNPWTIVNDTVLNIECVIDAMNIDYKYDRATITIVEKK